VFLKEEEICYKMVDKTFLLTNPNKSLILHYLLDMGLLTYAIVQGYPFVSKINNNNNKLKILGGFTHEKSFLHSKSKIFLIH